MSLPRVRNSASISCFPRVSGDEPAKADAELAREQFSPRERG